jgi:hypothetical protein
MEEWPQDVFEEELREIDFVEWALAVYDRAVELVYRNLNESGEIAVVSAEYVAEGRPQGRRLMALAGYRLAKILASFVEDQTREPAASTPEGTTQATQKTEASVTPTQSTTTQTQSSPLQSLSPSQNDTEAEGLYSGHLSTGNGPGMKSREIVSWSIDSVLLAVIIVYGFLTWKKKDVGAGLIDDEDDPPEKSASRSSLSF